MFFSEAIAQTTGTGQAVGPLDNLIQFIPFIAIFFVVYFFMIRPQQKKLKAHKEMIQQLRRGDRVLTQGGIIGKVSKISDQPEIEVEIAEGVKVTLLRGAITEVLDKTAPVPTKSEQS